VLLLIAGNETTTNLLGNFFEAMHVFPDELARLRDDLSLIPAAVEEALRYDPPVQGLWRGIQDTVELHGVELPRDARVMTVFASANRDVETWGNDADEFRISRNPTGHLAFGTGIHVCLGAALARLEARVAISTLIERTAHFERAAEPTRSLSPVLRGVRAQPLRIAAA
jgi:cytochrome P450